MRREETSRQHGVGRLKHMTRKQGESTPGFRRKLFDDFQLRFVGFGLFINLI